MIKFTRSEIETIKKIKLLTLKQKLSILNDQLTDAERKIKLLKEALAWCSGSSDFAPGGKARKGWLKIRRLLDE